MLNNLFLNYLISYIAQHLFFLLNQRGPKKTQSILVLLSRGWNPLPGACSDLKKWKILEETKKYVKFVENCESILNLKNHEKS